MADLSTLIRLHKHELDEKRTALAALYAAIAEAEKQERELDRAFQREKEAAGGAENVHYTFAAFVEKMKLQKKTLALYKQEMEKKIEEAKESMMETFSELKKYEMTQAERDRLAAEERALKESKMMDEIGLEGFRRKSDEN